MFSSISSPLLRQYAVVIVVNFSVLCLGMCIAWPSPVLVKLRDPELTVLPEPITEDQGSWVVSIGFLFAVVNAFQTYLVDRLGRKFCVILSLVPTLAACVLLIFANQIWMLLLARIIISVTSCMIFTVVPMYASEIASKEVRGALGTILQISASLGIVTMLSIGPFISYIALNVVLTCAVFISTIPVLFLPDSPYFLYSKGRTEKAIEILTFLRGSETLAKEEIKEYALANTEEKIDKRQILKNRIFLKSIGIVIVLGVGGQLVGFNAISFYLQTILESTRTDVKPEFASVIIGFIQLTAGICTIFVTDRFGRKPILCSTSVVMALGMIGMGTFFEIRESGHPITGFLHFLPLVSLIVIIFCFSAGYSSLYWMLITELFEGPTRAIGVTTSVITSSFSLFLILRYFPLLSSSLGPSTTYWIFAVNCVLFAIFILFCVPETKGKTFAEVQVALGAKSDNDNTDTANCALENSNKKMAI